jgi:transcriptional regulator with XRE-family HTH domain
MDSISEDTNNQTRKPNPIDVHVGGRIRLRRMMNGLSQERLGEQMGLTFQQIQKYEKGANRVGASRLFQLAQVLEVPVSYFFEDLETKNDGNLTPGFAESSTKDFVLEFLNSREGLELNRAFVNITDPEIRRRILDLVRSLSENTE